MNMWWETGSSMALLPQPFTEQRRMWSGKLASKLLPSSFKVSQINLLLYFYPSLAANSVSKDVMFINLLLSRINLLSTLSQANPQVPCCPEAPPKSISYRMTHVASFSVG